MKSALKTIELLSPARDLECGIEAVRHGADAVYIGAPMFGARIAAGNTIEDIAKLCKYAHLFSVKVYVTLNTILYDNELPAAEKLVWVLWQIGVDALIIQDLAYLQLHLPPISLHASTQMDNRNPLKAKWLEAAGFSQIIVARELSLQQIRSIHETVNVPIEAFVHGALCVSYSGKCYASHYCFKRSANRGCCAQFCRLPFNLFDGKGKEIVHAKHLLSLRDMKRIDNLEEMMDAGVQSFKIEGRLKDSLYVKNVTAHYRQAIDAILERRKDDYIRSSYGKSHLSFIPNVSRSFNRGFTDYFLHGRNKEPIFSPYTPKAIGVKVGRVEKISANFFTVKSTNETVAPIIAGDGLCFVNNQGILEGFRVNKTENGRIFPANRPHIYLGTEIYRSLDFAMECELKKTTSKRTLTAQMTIRKISYGYAIDLVDESGCHVTRSFNFSHNIAHTPQKNVIKQLLSKTGETILFIENVEIQWDEEYFIPASLLTKWRREICKTLEGCHLMSYRRNRVGERDEKSLQKLTPRSITPSDNISNYLAKKFYEKYGANNIESANELSSSHNEKVLMTCKHCIRHDLNICKKYNHSVPDPLTLSLSDGKKFLLQFDCKKCEMQVLVHPDFPSHSTATNKKCK